MPSLIPGDAPPSSLRPRPQWAPGDLVKVAWASSQRMLRNQAPEKWEPGLRVIVRCWEGMRYRLC